MKLNFFYCLLFIASAVAAADRPNLIFLLADDQRADALSCAGHPLIKTPNLDRLAGKGIRFKNAYTVAPVCAPSRVSFLLGQYQRTHKIGFSGKNRMSESQWGHAYPELLRRAGYYTGFIGKFGVEKYEFKGRGAEKFDYWKAHDGWAPFYPKQNPKDNTVIYDDCEADFITPIMGECMEDFLEQAPAGQPFCLSVSFSAPHGSVATTMMEKGQGGWMMNEAANSDSRIAGHPTYGDLYRDQGIKLPGTMDGNPEMYFPKHVMDQEQGRQKCYAYSYTAESVREHTYRYAQLITGIDQQIGRLVKALEEKGMADNTIIIYSADNGLLMGDYNQGGKALVMKLACNVPFIIFDPRLPKEKTGQVIENPILSIDLAPTLLEYAGVEMPGELQGQPLQPVIMDSSTGRDEVLLESLFALRGNPLQEGLMTVRWKYIKYQRSENQAKSQSEGKHGYNYTDQDLRFEDEPIFEQLFDLQNDPGETKNLAVNPEYEDTLNRMREKTGQKSSELNTWEKGTLK